MHNYNKVVTNFVYVISLMVSLPIFANTITAKKILPPIVLLLVQEEETLVGTEQGDCSNTVYNSVNTYTPTSASQIASSENAGKVALISSSFSVANTTFAADQIIVPDNGILDGTNINLNGAKIIANHEQAFASSARFSSRYADCLTPELFGAAITINDADAIEAMVVNGNQGINQEGGTYTVASPKTFTSSPKRTFRWYGNDSIIRANFASISRATNVFSFNGVRAEISDWTLDGQDLAGQAMYITNADFLYDNIVIKNFLGQTAGARASGVHVDLYTNNGGNDFKILNSKIHDIESPNDGGAAAASLSISRAVLISYRNTTQPASLLFKDSEFHAIHGVDGDALHFFELDNNFQHDVQAVIDNSTFWNNSRRDIKAHMSNVKIRNSTFTKLDPSHPKATSPTVSVGFGVTGDTQTANMWVDGAEVTNSTFNAVGTNAKGLLGLTSARNGIIKGNTFNYAQVTNNGAVLIDNRQQGNVIEDNTFVNGGIILGVNGDQGYTTVNNNNFTFNVSGNPQSAVIRNSLFAGINRNINFINNNVTLNFANLAGNFYGILGAHLTGMKNINMNIADNNINYTGNTTGQKFMEVGGDFSAGNTVQNNLVNGIDPVGAFQILGASNFTNVNNVDGNGNPLTKTN